MLQMTDRHFRHSNHSKAKLFTSQHGGNGNITTRADDDMITQFVIVQSGMGLCQTQLPRASSMLNRGQRRSTCSTIITRNLNHVGISLGHTTSNGSNTDGGHEFHRDTSLLIDRMKIMNQLCQILNTVNVLMGWGSWWNPLSSSQPCGKVLLRPRSSTSRDRIRNRTNHEYSPTEWNANLS